MAYFPAMDGPPVTHAPSRRAVLRAVSAAALTTAAGSPPLALSATPARRRVATIAHLTDTHIQPEKSAAAGFAAALRHVQEHGKPDLILFGGDNLMCVNAEDDARVRAQVREWTAVLKAECGVPHASCIGNHDILGLKSARRPDDGKLMATDLFCMPRRFFAFERFGWKFITLDSTLPIGGGFVCQLDPEQLEWLSAELKATPRHTPVCVLSHMPILSVTHFTYDSRVKDGNLVVPGNWGHLDCIALKDLFRSQGNVRLALSGHMHTADRCEYLGTSYLCNGAVSGGWWDGPCNEFENGYGLLHLFDDGSFDAEYVTYGWKATGAK